MFNCHCLFVYFLFRLFFLRVLKLFSTDPPAFTDVAEKALMMGEAEEGQPSAY